MKSIIRLVAVAALFLCAATRAHSQAETILSYCNDRLDENSLGFSWDDCPFSAGIYLPEEKLEPYAGGKIISVRIGLFQGIWEEELTDVKLWIKTDIRDEAGIYEQEVGTCKPGWNDVVLDVPFELSGSPFYIGYDAVQKTAGNAPVSYTRYDEAEMGSLYINGSDQSQMYNGSLSLQCIVSSNYSPEPELAITGLDLGNRYFKQGEEICYTLNISNSGRIVKDFQIQYSIDGQEPVTENRTDSIGSTGVSRCAIADTGLDMGLHTLQVKITQVEGKDVVSDAVEGSFMMYDKAYDRGILLELVTSADCRVCPLGSDRLIEAMEGHDNVNWVSYHMNMAPGLIDPLTIPFSSFFYNMMFMYGVPMFTLDRTDILGDGESSYACAGSIDSTLELFDAVDDIPAFASITARAEYDMENQCLDVSAEGERSEYYNMLTQETRLSVLVVEDSLVSYQNNNGEYIDDYVHNNVVRKIYPDDGYGVPVEWNGDTFSFLEQIPFEDEWLVDNLRCVVFLHKPIAGQFDSQVMNSYAVPVRIKGALCGSVQADAVKVFVADRRVVAEAGDCTVEVFDLSGKKVANCNLSDGLYVARVTCGNSTTVHKVAVR